MVDTEIERIPKVVGDNVVITSNVKETMSIEEFKRVYGKRVSDQSNLQEKISILREELKKLDEIAESKELEEFAKKMSLAAKILKREELKENLKEVEKQFLMVRDEMKRFNPLAQRLFNKNV